VLGGLISEQEKRDTQGMPFLSRIPGVGNLFKDNKDSTNRSELIIFIQPQVINDNNALRFASMREDVRTKVGADAAEKFPQQPVIPTPTSTASDTPQKKGIFSRIFSSKRASTPLPGRQRQ
ncbi:MAG TPA: hypothetical protein DIT64_09050, partial [Verrucomicrobiales bacterium]|nr:hypothetical protein [Verrucomicrobiales bacterium]